MEEYCGEWTLMGEYFEEWTLMEEHCGEWTLMGEYFEEWTLMREYLKTITNCYIAGDPCISCYLIGLLNKRVLLYITQDFVLWMVVLIIVACILPSSNALHNFWCQKWDPTEQSRIQ